MIEWVVSLVAFYGVKYAEILSVCSFVGGVPHSFDDKVKAMSLRLAKGFDKACQNGRSLVSG